MLNYIKNSFKRKIARRVTKEYSAKIDNFYIEKYGNVAFANWNNPLVAPIILNDSLINFFGQFIKDGDLVIDIGANSGDTTVPMALCAGKKGLTIGFDPNPYVFKILQENAALNSNLVNIVPEPYAISEAEEEFYYISSEASFGNGGISPTAKSKHGKFIHPNKIKGVNLKKFLEEKYAKWIDRLSFIKIDTEGYDKEIIKSITDLLLKYKPIIIAESFDGATNEEKIELYEVISNLGYDIFYFEDFKAGCNTKMLTTSNDITMWKETINIYAIPRN